MGVTLTATLPKTFNRKDRRKAAKYAKKDAQN